MNTTLYKVPRLGALVLVLGLLYTCSTDSHGVRTPTLKAGDIQYDKVKIAQGIADKATLSSSTASDLSGLQFSIAPINSDVATDTHEPPTITEDGTITITPTTSPGSYRVTITPDGNTFTGILTMDFYVTVKPTNLADIDAELQQGIADYGPTGDFNYLDTSAITDMSYLFSPGRTPGTGTVDVNRTYSEKILSQVFLRS